MAKKFYAVRKGKTPGIYTSWDLCREQVRGFSGAEYKGFPTMEEAEAYMGLNRDKAEGKTAAELAVEPGVLAAYVDGSYSGGSEFSYGMVLLGGDGEQHFCEKIRDGELAKMRNVAGEIKGAEAAMRYALEHGFKRLIIYHDYEGIAKWCQGDWKTNRDGTKAYREYYDSIRGRVDISFVKVAGHSGDKYNDMADALAKQALGIEA
ncbi:MAG: reverse transcriptase-like protein [Lachnospiraceae bacterium]|nr:reverse transcriptase-like protein [Lachnospiraceae bacterium]